MPSSPKKISRSYIPERKPFQREVDNNSFYNSWKWRKFTKGYKQRNPLCKDCEIEGVVKPVDVVDHKEQYAPGAKGWDLNDLRDEDYNPLCNHHHNKRSGKQRHGKG